MKRSQLLIGFILAFSAAAASALAMMNGQTFAISWYTMDGGGGDCAGGPFDVRGTIGQHDAAGVLVGGAFEVRGGFWAAGAGAPMCPADCGDSNGSIDVADLLALLGQWGVGGSCDVDSSGVVDVQDLLEILSAWGPCP